MKTLIYGIKNVGDAIENEAREQGGEFLGILLGTLSANLLRIC